MEFKIGDKVRLIDETRLNGTSSLHFGDVVTVEFYDARMGLIGWRPVSSSLKYWAYFGPGTEALRTYRFELVESGTNSTVQVTSTVAYTCNCKTLLFGHEPGCLYLNRPKSVVEDLSKMMSNLQLVPRSNHLLPDSVSPQLKMMWESIYNRTKLLLDAYEDMANRDTWKWK